MLLLFRVFKVQNILMKINKKYLDLILMALKHPGLNLNFKFLLFVFNGNRNFEDGGTSCADWRKFTEN